MSARIRKERVRLEGLITQHQASIAELQRECKHKTRTPAKCFDCHAELPCAHPAATRTPKANTGNYDPSADCWWFEFTCPDCGKFWTEDQ